MIAPDAKNQPSLSLMEETLWPVISRIADLYAAGDVKRLHTVPTLRHHSIGEHVYGTIVIASELTHLNRQRAAKAAMTLNYEHIIKSLLYHDAPELETGDVPAPVKRADKYLAEVYDKLDTAFFDKVGIVLPLLNEAERDIVKAADVLDLGFRVVQERLLGNRGYALGRVHANVQNYCHEHGHVIGVRALAQRLDRTWEELG